MDRNAPYRINGTVATPHATLLSVPDAKMKMIIQGTNQTMYHSLYAAANQKDYIMAGGSPPISPNGYAIFTPEFDMAFPTLNTTDVSNWYIETEMQIQTRGQRFFNTV